MTETIEKTGIAAKYSIEDLNTIIHRADVKPYINMSDKEFNSWYGERKKESEKLLKSFRLVSDMPSFLGPSNHRDRSQGHLFEGEIGSLERGLEYLNVIKYLRKFPCV